METCPASHNKKGNINEATLSSLITYYLVLDSRRTFVICILKHHDQKQLSCSFCISLTTNECDYRPWWAPTSYGLVALTIFEVSCGNFIKRILSRISGACWKLLMTDVSPHCHTPCIIWFGKQHTVFCSISMSQTVCKQLVITQFSENHYFPMKCWTCSKLGFGMASAAPMMQCSPPSVAGTQGGEREGGGEMKGAGERRARFPTSPLSLCMPAGQSTQI